MKYVKIIRMLTMNQQLKIELNVLNEKILKKKIYYLLSK